MRTRSIQRTNTIFNQNKPKFPHKKNTENINNKQTIEIFQGTNLDINTVSCTRMSPFLLSESLVKLFIYTLILGHYLCEKIGPSFVKFQLNFLSQIRKTM